MRSLDGVFSAITTPLAVAMITLWGRKEPIQPPTGRKESKRITKSIVVLGFENRYGAEVMPADARKGQEVYPNR